MMSEHAKRREDTNWHNRVFKMADYSVWLHRVVSFIFIVYSRSYCVLNHMVSDLNEVEAV